jgi:Ca2+-binding EF-hand superfamily protein
MALFSLEIEGEYERTAMIQRILTSFTSYTKEFDSADPYEVMAYLLEGIEGATAAPPSLELMYRLFEHTGDVYARYSGMYRIVSAYSGLGDEERAKEIIRQLHETIGTISEPSIRAIMLSDLAGLMAGIDHSAARGYLGEAQGMLELVGPEREAFVRKNLIYAARSLNAVNHQEEDVNWAIEQVGRIEDPVEYVDALAAVFDMVSEPAQRKEILSAMCHTVVSIPSSYIRLSMLFDVAKFAETYGDEEEIDELLDGMERTAGYIQIPFITAMTRQRMAQMLFSFYRKSGKPAIRQRAVDVVSAIDDDRIRYSLMVQLEQAMPQSWKNTVYSKILDCRDKIRSGDYTTKDMVTLDRAIRAAPDRAKRATYYTEVYLIARKAGQHEVADRMLLCALEEARIIRPLSRRAFVLGDMACRIYAERYEDRSRELLDMAVSEALNIRDSTIRDEVYDELDLSMRIVQEHWL